MALSDEHALGDFAFIARYQPLVQDYWQEKLTSQPMIVSVTQGDIEDWWKKRKATAQRKP
jgi:hypothetical protein